LDADVPHVWSPIDTGTSPDHQPDWSPPEPEDLVIPPPAKLVRQSNQYVDDAAAEESDVDECEDVQEVEVAADNDDESDVLSLKDLVFDKSVPEPKKGSRRFFCTLNNWDEEEYRLIFDFLEERSEYAIIGKELAPTTGTPHLHIYLRVKNAMTFNVLRKKPGFARCDIRRCKGTEPQNRTYVAKDGDFVEIHPENAQKQGLRRDLEQAAQLLLTKGRVGLAELVQSDPKLFVQHHNGFRALLDFQDAKRMLKQNPNCVWFYGRSGHGKSHACWEAAAAEAESRGVEVADVSCASLTWCDGYKGEKICIFNDLRETNGKGTKIPMNFWTSIVDKWPCRVEVKGSSINMQADSFYITSVLHPSQFYAGDAREPNEQFLRRITRVIKCEKRVVDGVDVYTKTEMGNGLTPQPQSDIGFVMP
jgi:hypothetical protein